MSRLTALNAANGNLLWQRSDPGSSLSLVGVQRGVVYAQLWSNDGKGTISAFDASTGIPIWTMPSGASALQWGGIVIA